MRTLFICLVLGTLAACASSGGFLEYKPEHWRGADWAITGKAEHSGDGDVVSIKINDADVLSGKLSQQQPEGEFTGNYENYNISAKCKLENASHDCTVSVDNKVAGQLSF